MNEYQQELQQEEDAIARAEQEWEWSKNPQIRPNLITRIVDRLISKDAMKRHPRV